jgi:hypothetical protein
MKNLMILTAALLMVLGCEKQPDYNDIDWQGTWKQGAWEMLISDGITSITDSGNPLTIVDESINGNTRMITAEQILSEVLYLYEFECTLIIDKDNVNERQIDVELLIYKGTDYYGQAEFIMK